MKEQAHGKSASANVTFYFPYFEKKYNGHGVLGYSRLIDGKYAKPVKLSNKIN
ncbi:hypothetical protein [Alteromonas sp. ASW11-130]|uniref:hypothetical protein n=1 Tax=Alteromonas sp. ASW11-130 TaxID=3015775 RepID=UPI0022429A51|nr:hypothetical protein [Alteromonas sp. ASW11-130]MCW8092265.1 hypothetical protein [Alteromonas sp. ASW11-130]